ncbi:hypothetical protein ACFQX7_13485 [Luedemannella flava]
MRDGFCADLTVVYSFGPPFGQRLVTHDDLRKLDLTPRALRRAAHEQLEQLAGKAQFHGRPPALMLSLTASSRVSCFPNASGPGWPRWSPATSWSACPPAMSSS